MGPANRIDVLREPAFRRFIIGYGLSYIFYWITLLAMGWWMWETTGSAAWVGFVAFCDLFPAILVTPFAAAMADRGDRFRILKAVLWLQVTTGLTLALFATSGALTPPILAAFAVVEGTLVGFSQPAFFGLLNRLVSPKNLSAAVGVNVSVVHTSYILGPLLAGALFSVGLQIAPLAFAANAIGTLGYLWCLGGITLAPQPPKAQAAAPALLGQVVEGLTVFWTNPVVFRATVLILAVAVLQRPLISLMPAINDHFALLTPAYFTILTASVMFGGLIAGLLHARRNSDLGQERATLLALAGLIGLHPLMVATLSQFFGASVLAMGFLFAMGLAASYVVAGNSIILQTQTPEHMRSRVLGNNLMLQRAAGAFSVLGAGLLADSQGLEFAMLMTTLVVVAILPLAFLRVRQNGR